MCKHESVFNRRDALQLWHQVNLGSVLSAQKDLSARQLALLTCVFLEKNSHTVRSLALRLNVTKSIIAQILKTLESYKFTERIPDPADKRSVLIRCTECGSLYLMALAESIREEAGRL